MNATNELMNNTIDIDWSLDQYMSYIPALMWVSRVDGLATFFNQNWLDFVGRNIDQELGNGWAENVHPDDFEECLNTYTEAVQEQKCCKLEFRLKRHDGEYRWILDNIVTRFNQAGEFLGFIGTCLDITEHYEAKQIIENQRDELAYIVMHDHLTDAFNRRYLFEHAQLEIKRCSRYKHSLYLLLIDVDNFKNINDSYGHITGDEVLIKLVKSLTETVRPFDTVCRYAGDEFCIILPETDKQGIFTIAQRIRTGVEAITLPKAKDLTITLSIGAAKYNEEFLTIEDWLHDADTALYRVKKEGRNSVNFSESELGN